MNEQEYYNFCQALASRTRTMQFLNIMISWCETMADSEDVLASMMALHPEYECQLLDVWNDSCSQGHLYLEWSSC